MPASRSVIILLNWNSYEHTSNCIRSLYQTTGVTFDIIVVDNGSVDGSNDKLSAEFPQIKLLQQTTNLGFAGGNNRGFEFALTEGYEYILMLNNDVFVEPDFMTRLVHFMDQHPEVGAVQPKIFFNDDRTRVWNGGSWFSGFFGWTYSDRYLRSEGEKQRTLHEVDWITGCAFFIRASVLEKTGLLNEDYFIYYEDVDLSFRIRSAGYRLFFHPESVIYHIAGMSHKSARKGAEGYSNPKVHYLNFRNHAWFLRTWTRWYQWPTTFLTYMGYALAVITYFALRFRFKKVLATGKGIYHGFTLKIA